VTASVAPDSRYRQLLLGAFAGFNALRMVSYLPMLWAIHASGQSSQHSLWTWFIWLGSNLATGLWHLERQDRRFDATSAVLLTNAFMCAVTVVLIAVFRW
jgi:hypothetical protein